MLSEAEVRKIYEQVDNRCKEIKKEHDELFSKVTDMVTAEWAVDRQRRLTENYTIWINVRHQLARVLEIKEITL